MVYAIEELDGVKESHRHLVSFDFPLVILLWLLMIVKFLHLGVEPDPPAGPLTNPLAPETRSLQTGRREVGVDKGRTK